MQVGRIPRMPSIILTVADRTHLNSQSSDVRMGEERVCLDANALRYGWDHWLQSQRIVSLKDVTSLPKKGFWWISALWGRFLQNPGERDRSDLHFFWWLARNVASQLPESSTNEFNTYKWIEEQIDFLSQAINQVVQPIKWERRQKYRSLWGLLAWGWWLGKMPNTWPND